MSLLKTNEIQNYNGSSLTLTASTVSTSAQLNTGGNISVTGSLNVSDDSTTRTNLGLGSMATQNANSVAITGGTINTVQPATGQSLTIKDEDGNTAITIGTDNTAAGYLSLNFGSYHGDSSGAGLGTLTGNTLDDYEHGTYTVTLTPTGGSFTMDTSRNTFKYIKIGNVCHVFGYTRTSSVSSPTGYITFNLPFTSAASTEYSGYTVGICIPENITTINSNELSVQINASTSTAQIYRTGGGGTSANWVSFANYWVNNTNVTVMLTYETA